MILGRLGEPVIEDFSVLDNSNNLVSSIPISEFTAHLFDPNNNEVYDSTAATIIELGHGHYRLTFTPNIIGTWYLNVYHSTYFAWGKSGTIQVFSNDFDTVATMLSKILGLVQENFYIDQTTYDSNNNLTSSRVRIYLDASSTGTNSNVLETYQMTAAYDSKSNMTSYKMVKL